MRINVLRHKARMRDFRVQYNNACNRTELMRTFKSTQEKWQATLLNSALLQNPYAPKQWRHKMSWPISDFVFINNNFC